MHADCSCRQFLVRHLLPAYRGTSLKRNRALLVRDASNEDGTPHRQKKLTRWWGGGGVGRGCAVAVSLVGFGLGGLAGEGLEVASMSVQGL